MTDYTCGPACLRMVLAFSKMKVSETSLAKEMGLRKGDWTSNRVLLRTARMHGLRASVRHGRDLMDIHNELSKGRAVIVNYIEPGHEEGHFAVVVEVTSTDVVMNDPWHGKDFSLPRGEFLRRWKSGFSKAKRWAVVLWPRV